MKAEYIIHSGDDDLVATAARVSFDKVAELFTPEQNEKLIRFLARGVKTKDWRKLIREACGTVDYEAMEELLKHIRRIPTHWAPFGHPHITLRMEAPVPIARQAYKHKIGYTESEESRRYIDSRPMLYLPEHFRERAEDVKQGSGGVHPDSDYWLERYSHVCQAAIDEYCIMVGEGVCPEQARFILPQGCEVHWIWTGSLYAYANYYNQRTDSHAQQESQELAQAVGQLIAPLFPISWDALTA